MVAGECAHYYSVQYYISGGRRTYINVPSNFQIQRLEIYQKEQKYVRQNKIKCDLVLSKNYNLM